MKEPHLVIHPPTQKTNDYVFKIEYYIKTDEDLSGVEVLTTECTPEIFQQNFEGD